MKAAYTCECFLWNVHKTKLWFIKYKPRKENCTWGQEHQSTWMIHSCCRSAWYSLSSLQKVLKTHKNKLKQGCTLAHLVVYIKGNGLDGVAETNFCSEAASGSQRASFGPNLKSQRFIGPSDPLMSVLSLVPSLSLWNNDKGACNRSSLFMALACVSAIMEQRGIAFLSPRRCYIETTKWCTHVRKGLWGMSLRFPLNTAAFCRNQHVELTH